MKIVLVFLLGVFLLNGCAIKLKNSNSITNMVFDKEGHRGCRGLMPENTIPAMIYAIDLEVTTLEMDVHISKDSQVVLSHDPWFNPQLTTKPDGSYLLAGEPKLILYTMDYADIARFDVGLKSNSSFPQQLKVPAAKPLLSVLIDSVEAYLTQRKKGIFYNIEIKSSSAGDSLYHPAPDKFVDLVMEVLRKKQITTRVIIQSFDVRPLKYLHRHYPQMNTSLLIEGNNNLSLTEQLDNLGFTPTIYSPYYSLVNAGLLKSCHERNIKVIPWTVNEVLKMKELKNMGVDGLISDYPNLYKQM